MIDLKGILAIMQSIRRSDSRLPNWLVGKLYQYEKSREIRIYTLVLVLNLHIRSCWKNDVRLQEMEERRSSWPAGTGRIAQMSASGILDSGVARRTEERDGARSRLHAVGFRSMGGGTLPPCRRVVVTTNQMRTVATKQISWDMNEFGWKASMSIEGIINNLK